MILLLRRWPRRFGERSDSNNGNHGSFPRTALPFDVGSTVLTFDLHILNVPIRISPSWAHTHPGTTTTLEPEMSPGMKRTAGRDLRQFVDAIRPSPRLQQVTQRTPRRTYASDEKPTFKGQLYESTQARLERERAEQARFARLRAEQKPGGGAPIWMTPISTKSLH